MPNAALDGSSSLDAVYDGVHGYIALDDMWDRAEGQIRGLLGAPYLQRLRHIKQLGFVSQSFLSAEHNRYAHALGTMHMMRALIVQLTEHGENPAKFWTRILDDVTEVYRLNNRSKNVELRRGLLFQHLLVAALLQDVGEYPYAKATEFFFRPMPNVKEFLRAKFSFNVARMTNKSLMTLALIFDDKQKDYIKDLNPEFLAFLLSGEAPSGVNHTPGMKILRHMLDGAIDADRLDYVYRDSYHALGENSRPTPMVDSLLTYDDHGPVLKHVRPATEFIAKRALLWSSVYHAPENRFRIVLLRTIFNECSRRTARAQQVFDVARPSMSAQSFLDFDDRWIEEKLHLLASQEGDALSPNTDKALRFLLSNDSGYEYRWVRMKFSRDCDLSRDDVLPNYFYFDLYSDYRSHSLYDKGSVRVQGSRYKTQDRKADKGMANLEDCVGPFSEALKTQWPSLPMPEHMAWFQPSDPRDRTDRRWERLRKFQKGEDDPILRGQFILNDPMLDGSVAFDTRKADGTSPPHIFISFRWDDYGTVYRITEELRSRHRRYFNLGGDYIGSGATVAVNSRKAVHEADAVIILYSESYSKRYHKRIADGAISAEISEMIRRQSSDGLPIIVLSMEPFDLLTNKLPWSDLGFEGAHVPAVGKPLRVASDEDLRKSVGDALEQIEKRLEPKSKFRESEPKGA